MGLRSKASRSARARGVQTKHRNAVKRRLMDRINTSLREGLCHVHYHSLHEGTFPEEQREVCVKIARSTEEVELKINTFFPMDGITLAEVGGLKAWLWTEEGKMVHSECFRWCGYIEDSMIRCKDCQKEIPAVIDLSADEEQRPTKVEKGESSTPGYGADADYFDPMLLDPDVLAMTPAGK